jgi:hypothetical protein
MTTPALRDNSPLLLRKSSYSRTLPTQVLDFQLRMFEFGVPRVPEESPPVPCVLVLTRAADREIDDLSLTLAADDIRLARIDSDHAADLALTAADGAEHFHLAGEPLRPRLVWLRHFDGNGVPRTGAATRDAYASQQWQAFVSWVVTRHSSRLVNRPAWHLDRLTQLAGAREAGLTVPRTMVTTLPARAAHALPAAGHYMVKPVGEHFVEAEPGRYVGVFPQRVSLAELANAGPEPAPVIIQEFVESRCELRIFTVGDETVSFRISKGAAEDYWIAPESVTVEPCDAPGPLAAKLSGLAARWGLGVAAFDVLVTADDYVFLEVNVGGDWCWFENKADVSSVSQAVKRYVSGFFGG